MREFINRSQNKEPLKNRIEVVFRWLVVQNAYHLVQPVVPVVAVLQSTEDHTMFPQVAYRPARHVRQLPQGVDPFYLTFQQATMDKDK
jgi:hypothetical protein